MPLEQIVISSLISSLVKRITDWLAGLLGWPKKSQTSKNLLFPQGETIRILPQPRGHWWGMGSTNGESAMQLASYWYITNITDRDLRVLGANIEKPATNGGAFTYSIDGPPMPIDVILPGETAVVHADFWINPPILKLGQPLKVNVVFLDQYGNSHRIKSVLFTSKSL